MPSRRLPTVYDGNTVLAAELFATLQWTTGIFVLATTGWFYLLDRTTAFTHFIGPRFFIVLLKPFGAALIASGLALRYRWPAWRLLQCAPWVTALLTVVWLQSLR